MEEVHGLRAKIGEIEGKLEEEMAALERAKTLAQEEAVEWKRRYGQVEAEALTLREEKQKAAVEISRLNEKNLKLADAIEEFKQKSVEVEKGKRQLWYAMTRVEEDVRELMKNHETRASKIAGDIAGLVEKDKTQAGVKGEDTESPIPLGAEQAYPVEAAGSAENTPSGDDIPIACKKLKAVTFPGPPPNSGRKRPARQAEARSGRRSQQ